MKFKISLLFLIIATAISCLFVPAVADSNLNKVESVTAEIIEYKLKNSGSKNVQEFIDGELVSSAGKSAEWYVIALSQYGNYDFSKYEKSLLDFLSKDGTYSLQTEEKYALSLAAAGSTDGYIEKVSEKSASGKSTIAQAYALHLLNCGYKSNSNSAETIKSEILSKQLSDGGWAVMGSKSDVDVTAMILQALAPHIKENGIKQAVDRAVEFLSESQLENGDYRSVSGPSAESTAQVITALSALNIDFFTDARFIKNGNTVFDGLMLYSVSNGGFSHLKGNEVNEMATVQAFYSLVSYKRMVQGKTPLFVLDNARPDAFNKKSESGTATSSAVPSNESRAESRVTSVSDAEPVSESTESKPEKETVPSSETQESRDNSSAEISESSQINSQIGKAEIKREEKSPEKSSGIPLYKIIALGILAILTAGCIIILLKGKRANRKNIMLVGVSALLLALFIIFNNFESVSEHNTVTKKQNTVGMVTVSINCSTVAQKTDADYIPDDGVILKPTEIEIKDGETVYDILCEISKKYGLQFEKKGGKGAVYISGINYLYELQFGDMSGWIYHVNGEAPKTGCDGYVLSNGDRVEWLYTTDLGLDVE